MQRALAYYKILGEYGPLQVETLRFLQKAVDGAYTKGENEFEGAGLRSTCRAKRQLATMWTGQCDWGCGNCLTATGSNTVVARI
jgi:hypothetical protein